MFYRFKDIKILEPNIFKEQLEWFYALKNTKGIYNEQLINFCDRWHLANSEGKVTSTILDAATNFIINIFKEFSLDIGDDGRGIILDYFTGNELNYYSIKKFILESVDEAIEKREDFSNKQIKEAACIFLLTDKQRVLMVTRKDSEKYGLPGGKVDFGETPIQAAMRELKEETNYFVLEEDLQLIFSAFVDGYLCHTYTIVKNDTKHPVVLVDEAIDKNICQIEEKVVPKLIDFSDFLDVSHYEKYNLGVSAAYIEYAEIFEKK